MSNSLHKNKLRTLDRSNSNPNLQAFKNLISASSSHNNSTTRFSETQVFIVTVQNLIPLIDCLQSENSFLKEQIEQIEHELSNLANVSENLAEENSQLRSHYHKRTVDLQQIIKTLIVETEQCTQDTKHKLFLSKEHNRIIANEIGKLAEEKLSVEESVKMLEKMIKDMNLEKVNKEDVRRDGELRSRHTEKIEGKTINEVEALEEEVCLLTLKIKALREGNTLKAKELKGLMKNMCEKPLIIQNTIESIKLSNEYKIENKKLEERSLIEEKKLLGLREGNEELIKKLEKCQKENYEKSRRLNTLLSKTADTEVKKEKTHAEISLIQKEKEKLVEIQRQLQEEINAHVKNNDTLKLFNDNQMFISENNSNIRIKQIEEEGKQINNQVHMELVQNIYPLKNQQVSLISNLKYSLQVAEQKVNELSKQIEGLRNPLKQVIRMEYGLTPPI